MIGEQMAAFVIASQRVGAKRRPMTGSAKQPSGCKIRLDCFVGPVSFSPRGDQNQNQNGNKLESNRDHRSCFRLLNYKPVASLLAMTAVKMGVLDAMA
jgi:hypothetical protein